MLSRAGARNNGPVPELPDLRILADAFTASLAGRVLESAKLRQPLVLRGTSAELRGFEGLTLDSVEQRGKFLTLRLGADRIVFNAMLTGRLGLAEPGARMPSATALMLRFGPRTGLPPGMSPPAWTLGGDWLPADDAPVELRYRDARKMGKVYLLPSGVEREVAGWAELGPDADDPALDLAVWQERIRRHQGELVNLLKNQAFVAGIGNAYSDEVLWQARLAPFRRRSSLANEESEALWRATREVMAWAVEELRTRVPPTFDKQARDFLRVHLHGGEPCPRCGTTLSEVTPGGFATTWCRACQT
jgi:formamidopyrimidine-DNA glycosylase